MTTRRPMYKIPQQRCKLVSDGGSVRLSGRDAGSPQTAGKILVNYYSDLDDEDAVAEDVLRISERVFASDGWRGQR